MTRAPNKCGWLMQGQKESCELSEAIQNLPPELREMILKECIAIKIKEKKEICSWTLSQPIAFLSLIFIARYSL